MTQAFILIVTLQAFTPQGLVTVPVERDFSTRADCIDYLDTQVQAMRRAFKGPTTLRLIAHCEAREVRR